MVASVSHMLTLRSGVMLSAKVPFLSVLSQVIVNLKSLNSGFRFLLQGSLIFWVFALFFLQVAFEDPEVQGIYLLTDGKPVSLHFMSCPQLKCFAKKSSWEINCWLFMQMCSCQCLFSYSKTANKKRAAYFPTLLQNQLNSDGCGAFYHRRSNLS